MRALAILITAGVLTYGIRSSMVQLLHGRELSPRWSRAFAGAIPAGLAAIIVGSLAAHEGQELPCRAVALVVGAVVALFTNRVLLVVGAGMATFWALAAQVQ
jgi:branched-subunit amino acid transport protein